MSVISSFSNVASAVEHLGLIAEELAFVAPNEDTGLLSINRSVMELSDLIHPETPEPIKAAVLAAKGWMDSSLDNGCKLSAATIESLGKWHGWMDTAMEATRLGEKCPDALPEWSSKDAGAIPGKIATKVAQEPEAAKDLGEEPAITLSLDSDRDLINEFNGESAELLANIEQGILVFEENPDDSGTIDSIFRAFHTFKGGAAFLHLGAIRDLAHDLESMLDAIRKKELRINSDITDLILAGTDALKSFSREITAQLRGVGAGTPILVPTLELRERAKSATKGGSAAPLGKAKAPAAAPVAAAPKAEAAPAAKPAAPAAAPAAAKPASATPPAKAPVKAAAAAAGAGGGGGEGGATGFVKLDTGKLDSMVDLVGELVIAQSMVVQNPDVQKINSLQLARCLRQLSRITTELQRNAMSLRMVPIRGVFHKMSRLVRDLGSSTQKQLTLILDGEDTELDRNIVEKLGDCLIHMIRNSCDHGIENPTDRAAAGKPPVGVIHLSAAHQRGGIVIRVQDDGKGLNTEKILAKATERGLVKPGAVLSDSEIHSLVFLPGFSTADIITDLSGRGVGMDVVQRNIDSLRGKVEITSTPGKGTTFTIVLPLTLAIIEGLIVGIGTDRYIIPTLAIRESFRPRAGTIYTVQQRQEVVNVRGKQTPILRLGNHLGRPVRAVNPEEGIIIVVESGDAARGILVDELIGKQEVVIKSLGKTFEHQNLLAGSAVLGDGWVGLILDVDTLVRLTPPPIKTVAAA